MIVFVVVVAVRNTNLVVIIKVVMAVVEHVHIVVRAHILTPMLTYSYVYVLIAQVAYRALSDRPQSANATLQHAASYLVRTFLRHE